ncbi:hypothetical protein OEJ84_22860 (plasmid) [Bacillus subtilis]|uniref:Uncharacterized protein n=2 Tax=Zhangjivirus TaxID=3044867 RepID=A0AAE9GA54_9CAUD|nr:hypothetical protein [Bacillus subtilis]YP_010681747.1 hypothetical protein PQE76_gp129 [Bacillus phage vB_BsuS_PJN02]YP_010740023.1 hypothetical protein P9294_gp006 [Bacillus phage FADO]UNH58472.1 hypothetical protein [Bacillus phage vB_BsuS_PJN02]UNY48721.1 hypothetical protein fado_6 [Bacillus phage FADO]WOF32968.1 hypothetical protein OEJ84_22860 [Bacillus subtilis]
MKTLTLTKEESDLLYYQLLARKEYFEEDMVFWAKRKDVKEVERCSKVIDHINDLLVKILNG